MSTSERAQLTEQLMHHQRQILHALIQTGEPPRLALADLTMLQLKALLTIVASEVLPIGSLGAALGVTRPSATLLVDALVSRGLVERNEDPADRRRTLVRLSAYGQELTDEFRQGRLERLAGWLAQLDDGDLLALARGLQALALVATSDSQRCVH